VHPDCTSPGGRWRPSRSAATAGARRSVFAAARKFAADGDGPWHRQFLAIPETFTIEVPIFHGIAQERVKIEARFRFRLDQGRLSLWYELVRPQRAVEDAYRKLWERVKKETGCPMFLGEP